MIIKLIFCITLKMATNTGWFLYLCDRTLFNRGWVNPGSLVSYRLPCTCYIQSVFCQFVCNGLHVNGILIITYNLPWQACSNTWFERISMGIILLNCVTLGMYQPCADLVCTSTRCRILEGFDHLICSLLHSSRCVSRSLLWPWGWSVRELTSGTPGTDWISFIVVAG